MVRKWSYLTKSFRYCDLDKTSSTLSSLYNFKVFRKTTRFKRYNRGITAMVRRTYARRKRRLNLIPVSYITKDWVLNYLKMRQFERYYSGLGRFSSSAYGSPVEVFYTRMSQLDHHNSANIISCSQNVFKHHTTRYKTNRVFFDPTLNSRNSIIQALSAQGMSALEPVFPNILKYEDLSYSYDEVAALEVMTHQFDASLVVDTISRPALNMVVAYYQILILSTIYNLNRSKK